MKIRVTIMTENDTHSDHSKEEIERTAKTGWNQLLMILGGGVDRAYVESCELVED